MILACKTNEMVGNESGMVLAWDMIKMDGICWDVMVVPQLVRT